MNGSNESEIREMRKNWRYLQNIYAKMHVPHVELCVCRGTMCVPDSHKAKQINILGSRQHPAEKVALWCEFFFFFFFFLDAVKIAGYSYAYKYVFNGV